VQPDGSVLLTWIDNASTENGYYIESRIGTGAYSAAGSTGANFTGIFFDGLAPNTTYQFKVRGFKGTVANQTSTTNFTTSGSITTPSTLTAPTGLVVTATDETSLNFTYNDNTALNTGYEIEYRLAGVGSFIYLGDAGDGTGVSAPNIAEPGTAYDFRVRAYYQNGANPRTYSAYSNTATVTTPFYAPTNLVATPSATSPYHISFSWTDNSSAEDSYELEYRVQGAVSFTSRKIVGAGVTNIANLPEFSPGTIYEFRIRARYGNGGSAYFPASGGVAATTRNGFSSKPYAPIEVGVPFSYQLATLSQAPRTSWSVGALPAGLSFDSGTGQITGTPATAGIYTVAMTANFSGGTTHALDLVLRVVHPPAAPKSSAAIGAQTITQGGSTSIALDSKFADPDTESALRLTTTQGDLDMALYSTSTPQTVANFLSYVTGGSYTDTFFHRAPAGFVMQGGGFKSFAAPDVFEHIATAAPVVNEPGLPNTVGTLAMAKTADDPNSATSEFFYSLGDNRANLDNQNGGFTVFGRVTASTLTGALTTLANLPVGGYNVKLRSGGSTPPAANYSFADLPIDQTPVPAAIDQSKLVRITGFSTLPILTYLVTANTNPSVATASIAGTSVQINALAPGATNITVTATDVDGNVTPQTIAVQVQQTFAQWANGQGMPGGESGPSDNPDKDAFNNLQEWALFGNPNLPDSAAQPAFARTTVGPSVFAEITFPVRKTAANLVYSVEASDTLLPGGWTTLWTSAQGFGVPAVSSALDQSDRTIVTVRDSIANPAQRFLRVSVQ
jgi:cyclophilin family peptidyl-prolyl cis-trans isomerase